jgi:hypothetical protein
VYNLFSGNFFDFFITGKCQSTNKSLLFPFFSFPFWEFFSFSFYIPTTMITGPYELRDKQTPEQEKQCYLGCTCLIALASPPPLAYGSEASIFNGGAGAVSLFTVRQGGRVPDYLPSRKAYDHFFLSHTSFSQLKDAALKGRLHKNPLNSNGVAGRSIAWKVFAQT